MSTQSDHVISGTFQGLASLRVHTTEHAQAEHVISLEFFQLYDDLNEAASSIESTQNMLQQAIQRRDQLQQTLDELREEMRHNRDFAREQIDRIDLVSSHWFYGTTALQPQLWFRGGCTGKIYRARLKLERCDSEYTPLLQRVTRAERMQLEPLERFVQQGQDHMTKTYTAHALRASMRERALTEYPSTRLVDLEREAAILKAEICRTRDHLAELDHSATYYRQAQQHYQQAVLLFQESLRHRNRFVQQLQTKIENRKPPIRYSPTQPREESTKDLLLSHPRRQQCNDRIMQQELATCQDIFQQGQDQVRKGNALVQKALATIPSFVQERYGFSSGNHQCATTNRALLAPGSTSVHNEHALMTLDTIADANTAGEAETQRQEPGNQSTRIARTSGIKGAIAGWFLGGPFLAAIAGFGMSYYALWKARVTTTRCVDAMGLKEDNALIPRAMELAKQSHVLCQHQTTRLQEWKKQMQQDIKSMERSIGFVTSELIPQEQNYIWDGLRTQAMGRACRPQRLPPTRQPRIHIATSNPATINAATAPVVPTVSFETTPTTSLLPSAPPANMIDAMNSQIGYDGNHGSLSMHLRRPPAYAPHHQGSNITLDTSQAYEMNSKMQLPRHIQSTQLETELRYSASTAPMAHAILLQDDASCARVASCP